MTYFQVLLHGQGFIFNFDDGIVSGGFLTTRWVKALSERDAELKAVELVRSDQHLRKLSVESVESVESTPMIYLEDICQVGWFRYIRNKPGRGYSFYTEDDS